MRKKIILMIAIMILFNSSLATYAAEYTVISYPYNHDLALIIYENGNVDFIYKYYNRFIFSDKGKCKFAGFDKKGTAYLLMKNHCLYGFDYRKQKKISLIKIDKNVKKVKLDKLRYVSKYEKYNKKVYKLTEKRKKKLWKKAMKTKK